MEEIKEGDIFEGQINFTGSGNAIVKINEVEIFIYKKNTSTSLHLDTVKFEIFQAEKKLEGKVLEVLSRFKTQYVGRVQINKKNNKIVFVVPDSNKIHVDFYISNSDVKNDQKVVVEFTKWTNSKSPHGKIVKILGESGDNNTEMNSIMYEYGLPIDFPKEVIEESLLIEEEISKDEISKRIDIRNVKTITIDPVDAKDFDDAISIRIIDDNTTEIGVHIADVAHYVKKGSKLDQEALKRSTSVYLVDRCIPMLPERLSNGICSLKPNVDRLSFSVIFNIYNNGKILKSNICKTVIHSDKRYSYEEVQEVIEGGEDENSVEIHKLNDIAKKIRKARIGNGSIEMGGIEVRFKLAEDNKKPIGVYLKEQKDSNKLIEEFMLLANKHIAENLNKAKLTNVYRVHDEPNLEKINSLISVCKSLGYDINIDSKNIKNSLNELIKEVDGKPEENMIETLITRCMSKATYTTNNIGHYGLGFEYYSHFTSPIRRYPDIMAHRISFDHINNIVSNNNEIEDQAKWCSSRELIASKAQRDSIKYKQSEYLLDRIGQVFEGMVSGITDWGIYVELIDNKCEGMVRYNSIGECKIDKENHTVITPNSNIRLGDMVSVTVSSVDIERKQIDFTLF